MAGGIVTVFLDCDPEGEKGMKQALGYLAQLVPVRLAWTSQMHGGKFRGRQPESLTESEWAEIAGFSDEKRAECGDRRDASSGSGRAAEDAGCRARLL